MLILSLLVGVALPNFNSFIEQRRVDALQTSLIDALSLARSEAITRGENVSVCGIPVNQTVCPSPTTTGAADWSNGWRVFVESSGFIIRDKSLLQDSISISFDTGSQVQFGALGVFTTTANREQYFVIDNSNNNITSALSLRTTGRIRTCNQWSTVTNTCIP